MTDIVSLNGTDETALLRWAGSAERGSEHPLGRSIVERAEAMGVELGEPQGFQAVRGKGVQASVDGRRVLVGSRRLMRENGLDPAPHSALEPGRGSAAGP